MERCSECGRIKPGKDKGFKRKAIGMRQGALLSRLEAEPLPSRDVGQVRVLDSLVERGLARKIADTYIITEEGIARL
jgi:hypothetical protein